MVMRFIRPAPNRSAATVIACAIFELGAKRAATQPPATLPTV